MNVSFVTPAFLYALFLIAIPILIHLFNFRRFKKVAFTNVRFLQQLKEETNAQSKLKHLLVLICRILAIVFLVLAFAQPFIPQKKQPVAGQQAISVFVDNSFSMDAIGSQGTLLQQAQEKAIEVARAYTATDKFQLLTADFNPENQRMLSREEFIDQVQQIKSSAPGKTLSQIRARQNEALLNAGISRQQSYIISDFQQNYFDFNLLKTDTAPVSLIALAAKTTNNIYIDSCWLESPVVQINQPVNIYVRVKNNGDTEVENIPLKLTINQQQKAVATVSVGADKYSDVVLAYTSTQAGWQGAEIKLTDYPITFDDSYYFSFNIQQSIPVLHVYHQTESNYLQRLFSSNTNFTYKAINSNQIDYALVHKSNIILLNELKEISSGMATELQNFVNKGGTLVIFPDTACDINSYNNLLQQLHADMLTGLIHNKALVDKIEIENKLFKNVFSKTPENTIMPTASTYFGISNALSSGEVIMNLQGGYPFLKSYTTGKGKAYLFAVPLNPLASNFVNHYLFAPAIYNMALYSQQQQPIAYTIAQTNTINLDAGNLGESVFHLTNDAIKFDIIPAHKNNNGVQVIISDVVKQAGLYQLKLNNILQAVIALNYDRRESDQKFFTADNLMQIFTNLNVSHANVIKAVAGSVTQQLAQQQTGIHLWKWCIIITLFFLGLEILLLRFLK
ncbi:MAG: BatA domain-containing protein [Bacteroidia bacterium]|nr:BatA domain-containing protein [Bacteroidia bacterium]